MTSSPPTWSCIHARHQRISPQVSFRRRSSRQRRAVKHCPLRRAFPDRCRQPRDHLPCHNPDAHADDAVRHPKGRKIPPGVARRDLHPPRALARGSQERRLGPHVQHPALDGRWRRRGCGGAGASEEAVRRGSEVFEDDRLRAVCVVIE
jgi:hypothetical protein